MKYDARPAEMTALLTALITAQWFSSSAAGLMPAAGNAAYLAVLLGGAALCILCIGLHRLLPQRGLLTLCAVNQRLKSIPLFASALFVLLAATALRDTLSMLRLTLLPKTPRWFALLLLLPALYIMSRQGTAAVLRTIKLLAPLLLVLYALVLVLSLWRQANGYNLFPLLGTGAAGIGKAALNVLPAGAWLLLLCIDRQQLGRGRCGLAALLWSTGITTAGYLCCTLLFGSHASEGAFPLHRISLSGGLSYAFERAQAFFVFAWLPVMAAAAAAGLAYAVRCIQSVLPKAKTTPMLGLNLLAAALLALPDPERSPLWLNTLLQTNTQCFLLIPPAIALAIGKLQERSLKRKEENHA